MYRNVNEVKRLEIEMERQVFDLQEKMVVEEDGKEEEYDTSILKGFEQSLNEVGMELMEAKDDLRKQKYFLELREKRKGRSRSYGRD